MTNSANCRSLNELQIEKDLSSRLLMYSPDSLILIAPGDLN